MPIQVGQALPNATLYEWRNDGGAVSTRDSVKLKSL